MKSPIRFAFCLLLVLGLMFAIVPVDVEAQGGGRAFGRFGGRSFGRFRSPRFQGRFNRFRHSFRRNGRRLARFGRRFGPAIGNVGLGLLG